MNRSDFKHFLELPVRWGDMDAMGHVNNVQFMRYIESGRVAYIEEVLHASFQSRKESLILADIQCSFLQQLHYPVTIEVATRVSRLGTSSFQLTCALYKGGTEDLVAASRGVLVWFALTTQRPISIPASIRQAIIAYEALAPEV